MSAVTGILDYSPSIGFLKTVEVEVLLVAFEVNNILLVLLQIGSFSAHSLHFSQDDSIEFSLAFYYLLLEGELDPQRLHSASVCNLDGQYELTIFSYLHLSIESELFEELVYSFDDQVPFVVPLQVLGGDNESVHTSTFEIDELRNYCVFSEFRSPIKVDSSDPFL